MTARLAQIWRHPIKAHGRERLAGVTLAPGTTLPGDRHWAVAHDAARLEEGRWNPCANFSRAARTGALQAIEAVLDDAQGRVTLRHPDLADITFAPDDPAGAARFIAWARPLCDPARALPVRVVRAEGRGMTDTPFPSISLAGLASHRAVEGRFGRPLSVLRWRANLLLEGLAPWQEFDLVGRRLRIGRAVLAVRERIGRCRATHADPATGRPELDMLALLETAFEHTDFGVYAEVVEGGPIAEGDRVEVLA